MNKQKTFVETPSHTDTSIITAADAALRYIAATHGAEVPLEPFSAAVTAQALASALHPYKTPYGREIDNKMAAAISTAKQVNRVERECGCGWRGRLEDCLRCGEVGPLCPECRETTEEAEQEQTAPANQQRAGVYRKFNVSRTDGRDLPGGDRHGAEYFVLDVTHDKFAKPALAAYAAACCNDYPALADDMVRRYGFDQQQAEPVQADPAVAAIQFALETHSDGLHFLRLWNEGEFDLLRREWPEAPKDIYIGADPLLEVPAQPPAGAVPLALPEWMECDAKVQAGTANALERFIYANEPAGDSAAEFRAGLLSMLAAAQKGGA